MDINKDIIDPDLVKQKIVNEYKERIKKMKMLNKEKENEENIISNNNEEINKIIISNDKSINENNNINNQLNDIINNNFEKLKNDLINESSAQLSQIVMESKIKLENDDGIETPLSVEAHSGVVCSGCGICPIVGIRYKCIYCDHFDYCENCEKEKGYVHAHPLYKLRFKIN